MSHKSPLPVLLDRDISLLHFNERVFDLARAKYIPLLERLRYLCIVSSNLDELFEVRMEPHIQETMDQRERTGDTPNSFLKISSFAQSLVQQQYSLHNLELIPAFNDVGLKILSHSDRNDAQRAYVQNYFRREVMPLLVPIALDPSHPFPQVANKSLNFIVNLKGKDAFGRQNDIAIVKVPRVLPRVLPLPAYLNAEFTCFVLLSSVIRAHLHELFPDRELEGFSQFRVTRHSDLHVQEDEVSNLRMALRQGLRSRQFGRAVRLEVSHSCSNYLADFLLNQFNLPVEVLFRVHGPVNLGRLTQFIDQVKRPELLYTNYTPTWPQSWPKDKSIFERLKEGDILTHQPYETFDVVVRLLHEAVNDPDTLAIKLTIYRTGTKSIMMELLDEAVRRGKEVTVVVELKARFDEEANINWAEALEKIGAQVVYGVLGLKTHAKMMIITRREDKRLSRYAHLSTGNYNPRTASLYTDISYLTADTQLTADIDQLFQHLANQLKLRHLKKLWVAPFSLHSKLLQKIKHCAQQALLGKSSKIMAKMNSLTDERIANELILAGQAGVKIHLIVRGACVLPAGLEGYCDNITVTSIIGRFLEHSRVFYFKVDDVEELYLSSADWMSRNMFRRIELAWPVTDKVLIKRVVDECLLGQIADRMEAWQLEPSGKYKKLSSSSSAKQQSSQSKLMHLYSGKA